MGKTYNITVLPQNLFDKYMADNNINDSNVEDIDDSMFISIIGTRECIKYYLEEDGTKHWFSSDHKNVINLEFDDLSNDIEWHGHKFKAISSKQAMDLFEFIEKNINDGRRNVFIHCRAGISRSQAVACFIVNMYKEYYVDYDTQNLLPYYANKGVLRALMGEYYKKHPPFSDAF